MRATAESPGTLDFIVIGAMKAGTTSLFEYLRTHPELYLPAAKDLPFFSDDAVYERGWDAYARSAFLRAPPNSLWGTVTPQYMGVVRWKESTHRDPQMQACEVVADRIARLFDGIKLIALLRDPVERAVSHYWFSVRDGLEKRSLNRALKESLSPRALQEARIAPSATNSYVCSGEYGRLLDPYVTRFSRSHLCVQSTHLLARDPATVLREVWGFLEVDDSHVPHNLGVRYHVRGSRRRVGVNPWRLATALRRVTPLRNAWGTLPSRTREALKNRYRTAAYRFAMWNRAKEAPPTQQLVPDLSAQLAAHYASDLSHLESLVGPVPGVTASGQPSATSR